MIIKEATGSEVSTELRNRFLNPLGLNRSFLDVEESIPGVIAHGWFDINGDGPLDDLSLFSRTSIYSGAWTAGAMVSTAEDLVKWAQALFQGGVLSQTTLDQMLAFHSPCPGEPLLSGYGLGVCQFFIEGTEMWGHAGNIPGYLAIVVYSPDCGAIISVLINSQSETCITNVYTALLRVVLDQV